MLEQIFEKMKKKMTPEEVLKKSVNASIKERRKMIKNHASDIKKLFDADDVKPIFTPDKERIKKIQKERLGRIDYLVKGGEKLGGRSLSKSYKTTVAEIERSASEILEKLDDNKIQISDLERSTCYAPFEKKEMWTEEDVKNLGFDWMLGAIINYCNNRLDGKEPNSEYELSPAEFSECFDLVFKAKK